MAPGFELFFKETLKKVGGVTVMSLSSQPVRKMGAVKTAEFFEILPESLREKKKEISEKNSKYLVEIKKACTFATPTKKGRREKAERSLKVWKQ